LKTNTIFNIILAIGLGVLYILHFIGNTSQDATAHGDAEKDTVQATFNPASPSAPLSIAIVNTDSLWPNFVMYEQMKERLLKEKNVAERNFEGKVKQLESDYKELQEMAPFMSRSEGQKKQQALLQREQELYQLQEQLSAKLGESEMRKTEEMQKAVVEFINTYNESKGYNIILSKSVLGDVIHADSTFDITSEILEGLNEKYSEKAK